jgi:putative hydrolases of HD superfamily
MRNSDGVIEFRLRQQFAFIAEIEKLKRVLRRTSLIGGDRRENSAEHSWHVTVIAMLLAEYANQPVDLLKVLKMLLIHDIVEIDAGDTFAYDNVAMLDKAAREEAAARRLFGLLPDDQRDELYALWREFEAVASPEAQLANAADRLMPVLQNYSNDGGTWRTAGVDHDAIMVRLSPIWDGAAVVWEYVQTLLADATARGLIREA